jgi:hypothetical protein
LISIVPHRFLTINFTGLYTFEFAWNISKGGGAKCVEENDQGKIGLGWSFLGLAGCWALSLTN